MYSFADMWDRVLKIGAAAAGAVAGVYGGWDQMIKVLCAVMVIDYMTGCIVAWMGKSRKTEGGGPDSKIGFIGIGKKVLMLLAVLMAAIVDRVLPTGMAVCRTTMICFYIANEGLSILENLALAGVPFPPFIQQALEQLRERKEAEEDASE